MKTSLKLLAVTALLAGNLAFADCVLRQSDTAEIPLGPFVDATDGVTAETGLTISQADVRLKKCTAAGDCAAWAQVTESTSASHEENGWYEKDLDTTDTNTVGILQIAVHEAGALPVFTRCLVIETAIYDGLYADASTTIPTNIISAGGTAWASGAITAASIATDAIGAAEIAADAIGASELATGAITTAEFAAGAIDAAAIATDAIGAAELAANALGAAEIADSALDNATFACTGGSFPVLGITECGTAQSVTGTTLVARAGASFADDEAIAQTLLIGSATTGSGQSVSLTDNTGASDTLTIAGWPATTPTGTITYYLFGTAAGSGGGGGLDAAATRAALGLASANLDTQLAAIDDAVDTEVAAILVDTGTTLDDLVDDLESRLTGVRAGYLDNLSAGAVATQASVNTIDDFLDTEMAAVLAAVDTEVAAIKAKTDNMIFTISNQLDVNVESMNGELMCGTGDTGTPWKGCP